jgi:transposase
MRESWLDGMRRSSGRAGPDIEDARVRGARGDRHAQELRDTLAEQVRWVIGEDPLSGDVFVFCNKARNRIKLLCFDRGGYWLIARRLEQGTFAWPRDRSSARVLMRADDLQLLLSELDLSHYSRRAWYECSSCAKFAENLAISASTARAYSRSDGVVSETKSKLELENEALRAKFEQLFSANDQLTSLLERALREQRRVDERMARLLRRYFGPKAERIDPYQMRIDFGELADIGAAQIESTPIEHAREAEAE